MTLDTGSYSHVLVNIDYADLLKEELECGDAQFSKKLGMKHLAIVDGLENDFVIIP